MINTTTKFKKKYILGVIKTEKGFRFRNLTNIRHPKLLHYYKFFRFTGKEFIETYPTTYALRSIYKQLSKLGLLSSICKGVTPGDKSGRVSEGKNGLTRVGKTTQFQKPNIVQAAKGSLSSSPGHSKNRKCFA